jgi:hypothetical protein
LDTQKILEVNEKTAAEASKGKLKSRRRARATTPEMKYEEDEDIENIHSDCNDN